MSIVIIFSLIQFSNSNDDDILTIYSFRKQDLIKPLLDKFTEKTSVQVKLISAPGSGLLQRLINEGRNTPADAVITNGMNHTYQLSEVEELFKPLPHFSNQALIDQRYRSAKNLWTTLTLRARVIVYNQKNLKRLVLKDYQDIVQPALKGMLCARPSGNDYDPPLIASMLFHHGEEVVTEWLTAFVSGFARPPQGNDRSQIRDTARGLCSVALVNSYYLNIMLNSDSAEDKKLARRVKVVYPNTKTTGTHVNISAIGMIKYSNKDELVSTLLDYLTSIEAQTFITENNYEFPIRKDVVPSQHILDAGFPLNFDSTAIEKISPLSKKALLLIDNAEWR